jgi:hypothetical protein
MACGLQLAACSLQLAACGLRLAACTGFINPSPQIYDYFYSHATILQ